MAVGVGWEAATTKPPPPIHYQSPCTRHKRDGGMGTGDMGDGDGERGDDGWMVDGALRAPPPSLAC